MAIDVNNSVKNLSPNADNFYYCQPNSSTPWESITAAHNGIPSGYRGLGKKFLVGLGSNQKEYWYKDGVSLSNLVPVIDTTQDISNKANLVEGVVPLTELPPVYFEGLIGLGTQENPYKISGGNQVNIEDYLRSLSGYVEGTEKILYGGGVSGFVWGPIPSGNSDTLGSTTLTVGSPSDNSIPLSWTAVVDATNYLVQRSLNNLFTDATVVYNGALRTFSESGLTPSTRYYYRVRATASGFGSGAWSYGDATTTATGLVTPSAPTNGIVDDTADTFNWTNTPGYSALTNYEFTLNGGTSWTQVTVKPVAVGNENRGIGQVGVRVKADTGRTASPALYNTIAFTKTLITPAAPTNGVVDDEANTFDWTNNPNYSNVTDYETTVNGGTTWIQATEKPLIVGNVAKAVGQVGVRIKAVPTVSYVSTPLYNTVAFTVPLAATQEVSGWVDTMGGTYTQSNGILTCTSLNEFNFMGASSNTYLEEGSDGFVMMDVRNGTQTLNGIVIGVSTGAGNQSDNSFDFRMHPTSNNRVMGGKKGQYYQSPSLTSAATSKARLRFQGAFVYFEYSTNSGTTWTILGTDDRVAGRVYVKWYTDNVNMTAYNVRQSGFTVA